MSTDTRPSAAAEAPAQPERRRWIVGLLVVVGVIVAALGGFWLGRSTAPPTATTDPVAPYAASPITNEWLAAIYSSGPDATFADATTVRITRDGQWVGDLGTLTLLPGALSASNMDPMALMRETLSSDPGFEGKLAASAIKTEVIGSTLLACAYPWGNPECAWYADDSLKVFKGFNLNPPGCRVG